MKGFQHIECIDDISVTTARFRFMAVSNNGDSQYVSVQSRELNGKEIGQNKMLANLPASYIAQSYRCYENKALGICVIANIADFDKFKDSDLDNFDIWKELATIHEKVQTDILNELNYTRLARYIRRMN
jgi:hypothetical protein